MGQGRVAAEQKLCRWRINAFLSSGRVMLVLDRWPIVKSGKYDPVEYCALCTQYLLVYGQTPGLHPGLGCGRAARCSNESC